MTGYSWHRPFGPDGPVRNGQDGGGEAVSWSWPSAGAGSSEPLVTAARFGELARDGGAFIDTYGFFAETIGYGTAVMRLPFDRRHVRPGGTVAGPSLMALADFAAYAALMGQLGPVRMAVTTNLSISFLRGPPPADVIAAARVVGHEGFLAHLEVALSTEGAGAGKGAGADGGRGGNKDRDGKRNESGNAVTTADGKPGSGPYAIAHVTASYALPQD